MVVQWSQIPTTNLEGRGATVNASHDDLLFNACSWTQNWLPAVTLQSNSGVANSKPSKLDRPDHSELLSRLGFQAWDIVWHLLVQKCLGSFPSSDKWQSSWTKNFKTSHQEVEKSGTPSVKATVPTFNTGALHQHL